jgi:glycosyltransferase involved in cell wall biosynthesis
MRMKVLHLCTYDSGGAANAALRLHDGLLALDTQSVFASKFMACPGANRMAVVRARGDFLARHAPRIEYQLARLLHPLTRPVLTRGFLPGCGLRAVESTGPDVVNLHWVEHGMVSVRDLARLKHRGIPIVWTLHDLSPLTGGFGYRESAGMAPVPFGPCVLPGRRQAASMGMLDARTDALRDANLVVVAPSAWMADEARRSPVFRRHRVEHVPYGINTALFRPMERQAARARWNLPLDRPVILFGADTFADHRKGVAHLQEALTSVVPALRPLEPLLVGFGNSNPLNPDEFALPVVGLGRISGPEELAMLYSAADVFVCPSREDNLPNTIIESLACGTPVVGFRIGGIPDVVREGDTGYLADPYDSSMLGESIRLALGAPLREKCRNYALKHLDAEIQARKYLDIYASIIR